MRRDALLFAKDCDAELRADEAYFEIQGPPPRDRLLFANEGEKGRLMGASSTYIAKPWRREIYVQASAYPHPVVGHELAHVLAGSFGQGPFRVSGPLGGWIPDPGRIEGVARGCLAQSPNDNDDFTLDEWAKTLLELQLLPPLGSVFRLGFLGQNSSTAYTVAGAFLHWFHDHYGAAALRAWYGGESIERASGKSFAELEAAWRADLARVQVAPALLDEARVRFDRPSLFGRHCPRIVDKLNAGRQSKAGRRRYRGRPPRHLGAAAPRSAPHGSQIRAGRVRRSKTATKPQRSLLTPRWPLRPSSPSSNEPAPARPKPTSNCAQTASPDARRDYDAVAAIVADEDRLRTLDVKRSPENEIQRRAIVDLLVGRSDPGCGLRGGRASPGRLGPMRNLENGLPSYLLGKNLFGRGRFREAADYLDQALARKLSLPRVAREAWRTRLTLACAAGDSAAKARALSALRADPGLSSARRAAY